MPLNIHFRNHSAFRINAIALKIPPFERAFLSLSTALCLFLYDTPMFGAILPGISISYRLKNTGPILFSLYHHDVIVYMAKFHRFTRQCLSFMPYFTNYCYIFDIIM